MNLLLINAFWMSINILLALSAVIFGFLAHKQKKVMFKYFFLLLWLVFVPNTFYIVTDIMHIPKQWGQLEWISRFILIIQYLILEATGIVTFILAIDFFEKSLKTFSIEKKVIIVNFLIGFGIMLGKVERINSWETVTNPNKVIHGIVDIVSSLELVILALFFGIIGNLVYFLYKEKVTAFVGRYLKIKSVEL